MLLSQMEQSILPQCKESVFAEIYRVLKPDGKIFFADMIDISEPSNECCSIEQSSCCASDGEEDWANCVAGTMREDELLELIQKAGFKDVACNGHTHYTTAQTTRGAIFQATKIASKVRREKHWDNIFQNADYTQVLWYQNSPKKSVDFIKKYAKNDTNIIDVGCGASYLVDVLLNDGYKNITLLDTAKTSLDIVQRDSEGYFTTDKAGERQAYQGDINALRKPSADLKPVKGGGIIANFARRTLDGFKGQTSSEFSPKKSSVNSSTGAHNVPDEPGKEPNSVVEDDGHNNRVDLDNTGQNKSAQEKGIDDSQSGTPSQNKNSRIQGTPPSDFTQSVAQAREKVNALKEQFDLLDQTPDAAYGREHLASELEAQMQQYERTDPKYSQLKNMANTIRQGGTVKRGAITQGIGANLPPYVINNAQGSGIDFEHVGDVAKEMRANDLETQLGKAQHELDRATQFQVTNENTLQFTASGDKVASVAPEGTHTAVTPGTVDAKTMNFYDPKTLPTEDIVNQKRVALEQAIASGDSEAIKTAQGDLADASSKRNLYNSMSKVPFGKAFAVGVLGLGAYATTAEASSDINKGDYTRAGIDVVEFLDQTGVTTMGKAVYDTDALLKHLNAQEYQDNINTVRSANHGNSGGFTLMSYGDTQYRGVPVSFTSAENGHLVVNGAETGVNYDQFMQQNTMRQDDQINFARTITKTDLNKEGAMNYITQATTPVELAQRFNVLNSTIETPSFTSQSGIGSLIRSPNNSTPNERDGRYSQAAERVVNAFQSGNR